LILPLAHHNTIEALPVFAPVLVICVVLAIHYLRARRHWDEEEKTDREAGPARD
jgi:hypothetical protein